MKKILLLLFVCVCFNVAGQDTTLTERIQLLKEEYRTELLEGSIPKAEKLSYKLIRATADHEVLLWAIGEADLTTATASLNSLNTLFGTSYSMPSVIWGSGSTTDSSWASITTNEIRMPPKDTGYVDIGTIYMDEDDSMLYVYNGGSWAALSGTAAGDPAGSNGDLQYNNSGIFGADSKLGFRYNTLRVNNTTVDTGLFILNSSTGKGFRVFNSTTGDAGYIYNNAGGIGLNINNTGVGKGIYIGNTASRGIEINNPSSGDGEYITNSSNGSGSYVRNLGNGEGVRVYSTSSGTGLYMQNTGTASGISIYVENTNTSTCDAMVVRRDGVDKFVIDSAGRVMCSDSLFLLYDVDAQGDEEWVVKSAAGALLGDSVADAGYGLKIKIGPIERMRDVQLNDLTGYDEIAWYQSETEKVYVTTGRPSETIPALHASDEIAARHIANNRIYIYFLLGIVVLLIFNQVRLEIKIKKKVR